METILLYLFFNENNFKGNKTVYGHFIPRAIFKFWARKGKQVFLELDFGLSKWMLLDQNMNKLCVQDMEESNDQMLHFVRLLFPEDKTLDILNKNLKTQYNEKDSIIIQLPADNYSN